MVVSGFKDLIDPGSVKLPKIKGEKNEKV